MMLPGPVATPDLCASSNATVRPDRYPTLVSRTKRPIRPRSNGYAAASTNCVPAWPDGSARLADLGDGVPTRGGDLDSADPSTDVHTSGSRTLVPSPGVVDGRSACGGV